MENNTWLCQARIFLEIAAGGLDLCMFREFHGFPFQEIHAFSP